MIPCKVSDRIGMTRLTGGARKLVCPLKNNNNLGLAIQKKLFDILQGVLRVRLGSSGPVSLTATIQPHR